MMKDKEQNDLIEKMYFNIMKWFSSEEEIEALPIDIEKFKEEHDYDVTKIVIAITIACEMSINKIAQLENQDLIDIHNLMNKVLFQYLRNKSK